MNVVKLNEDALLFGIPKRMYTISVPSEVSEEFIKEEFGRTSNINLSFEGKPIRIHEGKMTYYESDGGIARSFLKKLVEEADKKKKEKKSKIEFDPELSDLQTEEKND
jgi:hypothetical protein